MCPTWRRGPPPVAALRTAKDPRDAGNSKDDGSRSQHPRAIVFFRSPPECGEANSNPPVAYAPWAPSLPPQPANHPCHTLCDTPIKCLNFSDCQEMESTVFRLSKGALTV